MKKLFTMVMIITLLLTTATGCNKAEDATGKESSNQTTESTKDEEETSQVSEVKNIYPMKYTDSLGKEIILNEEPKTIISTAPNLTETICAVGGISELVGKTSYCNYPGDIINIEDIGDTININIERIVEINPDVVFVSSLIHPDIIKTLEEQGITVIALYKQESIEGTYELITDMGKILNKTDNANKIVADMELRLKKVAESVQGLDKPNVYYMVGYGEYGDFTATGDTFINTLIELAGGNNIAFDGTNWMFSYENLVEANPDIIFLSNKNNIKNDFISADGYKDLKAVKEDKIYEINDDLLNRQGPRIIDALEELVNIFH